MKLSEKIYRIRKARGYSQEQFGSMLGNTATGGVSRQSASSWEKGENEPTLDNLRDIAKVLNVSFDVLLDDTVDLSDDKTMVAVLNGVRAERNNGARSKFIYWIDPYGVKAKDYVTVALYAAMLVFSIALIPLAVQDKSETRVWLILLGVVGTATIGLVPLPIFAIKAIVTGNPGLSCAALSPKGLTIHADGQANNTIFIPLEKIERIELSGKQHRNHGSLDIIVKGRERPVTLNNIFKPQETIDVFGKLGSYIEDSDGIKIL
ncbi:MAG: helix-turn-helix transcriptional regulator [Bacilli bacterium]|nr:helix-turn-helix transcriptional regulator [Bacilli bacterium]